MSKELVISANRHETKVALIEDDQLVEVYFQRANEYSLAGSIHKGRVTRVLPGMQSAFVDLGLERDTFLYVSDFLEEHDDFDKITGDERPIRADQNRDRDRGRDRDRDRDRDRNRREAVPLVASTVEAPATEATAVTEPSAAEVTPVSTAAPAGERTENPAGDRGPDRGERRGRRSRRRRRGSHGFPDSKYASGDTAARPPAPQSSIESPEAVESAEEVEATSLAPPYTALPYTAIEFAAPIGSVPLILPGESLAKYRNNPPPVPVAPALADVAPEELEETEEYDEPLHYPPENAMPDAPVHEIVTVEEELEVETTGNIEPPPPVESFVAATSITTETVESYESAEEEEQNAEDEERAPAVASLLDDDEDSDIQAMILGDVEGIEISSDEGPAATDENGQPPAESGSASVRERGGRFPHRVSRRGRRRGGRGNQQGAPVGAGGEAEALPESRDAQPRPEGDRPERTPSDRPERTVARPSSRPNEGQPSISDLLKEGQEIIVQIAKEPLGQKGARITSHIALPGRYVVYMPTLEHMGVSRKIASDEERLRLKRVLQAKRPGPVGGFITRTAAEGRTEDEIAGDMLFLYNMWADIKNRADKRPAPMLLHHDLDIVQRILRDQLADNFKAIWIDSEETYESVLSFVQTFQPALVPKVKLYTREAPIFDAFSVTAELEKALRPKVWLKSGGFIVINQTEALVAIDVNTGKYVGKTNRLEDTIVKTNTEAIKEIVRQIRLRDLGGIIVIDFIDMDERKNRQKVMQTLEEAMRVDRAPYKILQFNDFGLVAITRKRVKQSLERTLCAPCPHCEGAGYIKSPQTVVSEILIEARKLAKSIEGKDVLLRVHPDVGKVLKSNQNKFLEELEEVLRRPVLIKSDPQLHHEKFDLA
jgi:ribonuclease G